MSLFIYSIYISFLTPIRNLLQIYNKFRISNRFYVNSTIQSNVSQIKDQLIINNFNDKYIILINSQSNKKSYFCSFTTNMALNPFGIYCKFAINSESEAVLSFSVKCQSNKTDITLSPHLKNWVQKRGGYFKDNKSKS